MKIYVRKHIAPLILFILIGILFSVMFRWITNKLLFLIDPWWCQPNCVPIQEPTKDTKLFLFWLTIIIVPATFEVLFAVVWKIYARFFGDNKLNKRVIFGVIITGLFWIIGIIGGLFTYIVGTYDYLSLIPIIGIVMGSYLVKDNLNTLAITIFLNGIMFCAYFIFIMNFASYIAP